MIETWIYTLLAVLVVSLISLIGLITFAIKLEKLKKVLLLFVSFAAGALIGDAFIHLLPEAAVAGFTFELSITVLAGIITFFIVEKFIHWRHCHEAGCRKHKHTLAYINITGDIVHNFIDGMIIAASFLINVPLGIATTIAVILHEIPQEIGDFSILMHSGLKRTKALLFNFLTALAAIAGAVLVLLLGNIEFLAGSLIPFAAGGFIYIACADLIPELHKEEKMIISLLQLAAFIIGIGVMTALLVVG
ncbi:MAG: ZIP family metal transporter [Candidatus Aenigmarchaeota archaeon]|nr:ZIP family metal transporter [Candidatus Aenigmarchaeota archaeon]